MKANNPGGTEVGVWQTIGRLTQVVRSESLADKQSDIAIPRLSAMECKPARAGLIGRFSVERFVKMNFFTSTSI